MQDFTLSLYSRYDVFIKLHVSLMHYTCMYIRVFLHTMPVYVNCKLFFATPVAFVGENSVSFKDFTLNKFPLLVANPYFLCVLIFRNF